MYISPLANSLHSFSYDFHSKSLCVAIWRPWQSCRIGNVARIVSVPTGAKNSDACLLMRLPGVHRQKECPHNDRGSRNQKQLRRHLTSADECRRSAEEVQKHVQPHNSQSVGVSSLTASVSNSRAALLRIRGL